MTKISKLDALKAALVTAQARLAEATARLRPQLDAENAKANQLSEAHDKARKASSTAYHEYQAVLSAAEARLFPSDVSKALRAAIQEKVAQFPHANIGRLAGEVVRKKVAADPEVVAAKARSEAASAADEKARQAHWRMHDMDSNLSRLQRQLRDFRETVTRLEKEIERLPRYRETARERRADEKRDELESAETEAARKLLGDFVF